MPNQPKAKKPKKIDAFSSSITTVYKRKIWNHFVAAIFDYKLVSPGDKVCVCISGGKDSMCMAKLFQEVKRHNKFPFELVFLVMDAGYLLGVPHWVPEAKAQRRPTAFHPASHIREDAGGRPSTAMSPV